MAKWAKENGYSGIKSYGAHDIVGGVSVEPYVNLIIFEQATVDAAVNGVTPLLTNHLDNMYFLKRIFYSLFLGGCYYAIHSILLRIIRYFFFPTYAIRPFSIFINGLLFLLIFLILSLVLSWRTTRRKNTFEPHANYTLIYLFCNLFLIVTVLIDSLAGYTDLILLSLCTTIPITIISYFVERKIMRARNTEK